MTIRQSGMWLMLNGMAVYTNIFMTSDDNTTQYKCRREQIATLAFLFDVTNHCGQFLRVYGTQNSGRDTWGH